MGWVYPSRAAYILDIQSSILVLFQPGLGYKKIHILT
jgi:hypothetical protein